LSARTLQGEGPVEGDVVVHSVPIRHLQAHGSSLRDAQGRGIGAVFVLNDVTRIRRLESMRTDFVANVSHELKTPITSIKGFVETLLENRDENPGRAAEPLSRDHRAAGGRLSAIIDDLLSLSRIEQDAGRNEIALAPGRIAPVIEAAALLCEASGGGEGHPDRPNVRRGARRPDQFRSSRTGARQSHGQCDQVQSGRRGHRSSCGEAGWPRLRSS
jgi:two-component system, OmpR family, phosphate regulon sensor histidine kinase PhoR